MNKLNFNNVKIIIIDLIFDVISAFIFGFGINMFTVPNSIAPGGVTGISTLVNHITNLPIGTMTLLLNVPLLIASYKFVGKKFTLLTMKTVVIQSLLLDYAFDWIEPYTENPLLASMYGGVFMGVAIGIILIRGSCTGGSDIAGRLIQIKAPHVSLGRIFMMFDGIVLALSVIVYGEIEPAMFGLIAIYVSSRIIDTILYGMDSGILMFIISNQSEQIGLAIINELDRGATLLKAKGAFEGTDRLVTFCAVRRAQSVKLRKIVHRIDPNAFIVSTEASEILGSGFNPIYK